MKFRMILAAAIVVMGMSSAAQAEDYDIDIKGQHAFIQFKIKHLGYSWLLGSFDKFNGSFSYDEKAPEKNSVEVTIDTASINTNHALRNKHLRGEGFFEADKYPVITFRSKSYTPTGKGRGVIHGTLNLHGVSKDIDIEINQIGAGPDPWGGFRRGFEGHAMLHLSDYKMKKGPMLGAAAENIDLFLSIEGIRKQ
jgi:polyisoprenoid-binding protein YceI